MVIRSILIALFLIAASACSSVTKLERMPVTDEDYLLSKPELVQRFPEIAKYEYMLVKQKAGSGCFDTATCFFNIFIPDDAYIERSVRPDVEGYPLKEEVLNIFGEPHAVSGDYMPQLIIAGVFWAVGFGPASAVATSLVIDPSYKRNYFYEKGNYCIKAKFERNIKTGYKGLLKGWEWKEGSCEKL